MNLNEIENAVRNMSPTPYALGYERGISGGETQCPYPPDSKQASAWWNGYQVGRDDAEALPTLSNALNDVRLQPLHHAHVGNITLETILAILVALVIGMTAVLAGIFIGFGGWL
jgi:ribosome modulation factor